MARLRRPREAGGDRPVLFDLCCKQGGAGMGYDRAGFRVIGVDTEPQPRFPFEFVQADAMQVLEYLADEAEPWPGAPYPAAIHGSPPCQDHSATNVLTSPHGTAWMLTAMRKQLTRLGIPWVLENVRGAPLAHQDDLFGANGLELCGCMFPDLRGQLYEARWFETSFPVPQPPHRRHAWPLTKMGRPPKPGECMQVTGHFADADEGRRRMGAPWMTRDGLAQAIPPAYAALLGAVLLEHIAERAA
jgi:DNA (cytosine-5)-methyltransferase 1